MLEGNFFFAPVGIHPSGGFRRKAQQGLDRSGGLLAGSPFEHLAQKNERGNDRGGDRPAAERAPRAPRTPRAETPSTGTAAGSETGTSDES